MYLLYIRPTHSMSSILHVLPSECNQILKLHCFLRLMSYLRGVRTTSVENPDCEGLMYLFFCSTPLLLDRISPHLTQSADLIQPCLAQLV